MLIAAIRTVYGEKCFIADADYDNTRRYPELLPLYTADGHKHARLDPTDPRRAPGGCVHLHRENIDSILHVYEVPDPAQAQYCTQPAGFVPCAHCRHDTACGTCLAARACCRCGADFEDAENQAREQSDATAPRSEILDADPLNCEQPAITREHAAEQAIAAGFGTRSPRPLRPARQDDLFNPMPQRRLF